MGPIHARVILSSHLERTNRPGALGSAPLDGQAVSTCKTTPDRLGKAPSRAWAGLGKAPARGEAAEAEQSPGSGKHGRDIPFIIPGGDHPGSELARAPLPRRGTGPAAAKGLALSRTRAFALTIWGLWA